MEGPGVLGQFCPVRPACLFPLSPLVSLFPLVSCVLAHPMGQTLPPTAQGEASWASSLCPMVRPQAVPLQSPPSVSPLAGSRLCLRMHHLVYSLGLQSGGTSGKSTPARLLLLRAWPLVPWGGVYSTSLVMNSCASIPTAVPQGRATFFPAYPERI